MTSDLQRKNILNLYSSHLPPVFNFSDPRIYKQPSGKATWVYNWIEPKSSQGTKSLKLQNSSIRNHVSTRPQIKIVDHAAKRKKHAINCNERLRAGSRSSDVVNHFLDYQSNIKSNAVISDRMLPCTQIGKRGRESSGAQSIIFYTCTYRLSTHLINRFNENPL